MAKIDIVIEEPSGKPVKNNGWKNMKKTLKDLGFDNTQVDEAFGGTDPKYATDIQMSQVLKEFLNAV